MDIAKLKTETIQEFVKRFNDNRKSNKGQWAYTFGNVNGVEVKVKSFNKWIQMIDAGNICAGYAMEPSVKQLNQWLTEILEEVC